MSPATANPEPPTANKENIAPRFGTVAIEKEQNLKRPGSALEWAPRKKPATSDPLVHHGRHFGRTVFAFANVHSLVLKGIAASSEDPPQTAEERRELRIFAKLMHMVPNLEERLHDSSPEQVAAICGMVQKGANSARSDDTRSIKGAVLDWIAPQNGDPLLPPLSRNSKLDRGFNHPVTGALLCPTSLDWKDESVRKALQNKELIASGADWPMFLYRDEKYDPQDPWRGLLRSRLLVLGFKHIFTSPSSTDDNPRATRSGNARIHGMTRVTPASIAYVATQVRFALSSASTFCRSDRDTDSELFYHSILELLEDPEEQTEILDLLNWWNRQIFPAASNGARIAPTNSVLSKIKARRALRSSGAQNQGSAAGASAAGASAAE